MLSTSARLLRLLSLLQARRHWAGADLAAQLDVHPRTLRRDVERLRELGYPVHASSGVAGGYALRSGQALPPLLLDDEEALAAAIALRTAAAGSVGGIEEPALRAWIKLEQVMPARLRRRGEALREAIVPLHQPAPPVEAGRLAALAGACRDQLRVAFAYADSQGRASARRVDPLGLVHTGGRWYLAAWDTLRQDWRTFRVDRIDGDVVPGAHFVPHPPPPGGSVRAYVAQSLAMSPYAEHARVLLHAPHEAMARRIPPSAALLEPLDGGRCLLQCGAHGLDALLYWLLALDVDFEVLAPEALRERLASVHRRLSRSLAAAG